MLKPYYETDLGKLYHGDCFEIMPYLNSIDLVLTDPPYGMNNDPNYHRFSGGSDKNAKNRNYLKNKNKKPFDKIINDDKPFDPKPFMHFKKVILFGYNHFAQRLPKGTLLIWIKKYDKAFGTFLSDAEIAWMKGNHGIYCKREIIDFNLKRYHPNQKPIEIIRWCLKKSCSKGIILDPFLGSGTTAVVCEQESKPWIGIEIEEKYCEVAANRIEKERSQLKLFDPLPEQKKAEQLELI